MFPKQAKVEIRRYSITRLKPIDAQLARALVDKQKLKLEDTRLRD